MPTITHTDYLFQAAANGVGLVPGVWVRLNNNSTLVDYFSTAVTDATSAFTHSAPPGDYSLYTGNAATVPGTPTLRNAHYSVPVTAGDDVVGLSFTADPTSPYTSSANAGEVDGLLRDIGGWGLNVIAPKYGVTLNSAGDQSAAINQAITDAAALGANHVLIPGTAGIQSTITMKNKVALVFGVGGGLKWTASAPGGATYMLDTGDPGAGNTVTRPQVFNGWIDANNTNNVNCMRLVSTQFGRFSDLNLINATGSGSEALRLDAISGSTSVNNTVENIFSSLRIASADTAIAFNGTSSVFTTNNKFLGVAASDLITNGLRFIQWCDSNRFYATRLAARASVALNFMIFNDSGTPASDVGVYNEQFYSLFCDGSSGLAGQKVFTFNWTYGIYVKGLWTSIGHGSPGTLITDNNAKSYDVELLEADTISGNAQGLQRYTKNSGHQVSSSTGTPASSSLGTNVTSITPAGDDNTGTLTIVTSGATTANASLGTITFANSYGATVPFIQLSNHAFTTPNMYVFSQSTGVSFTIAGAASLGAGTFIVKYSVIGKA